MSPEPRLWLEALGWVASHSCLVWLQRESLRRECHPAGGSANGGESALLPLPSLKFIDQHALSALPARCRSQLHAERIGDVD
jgi:hypothetical protein